MEYLPIIANLEGVSAHRAGTRNKQKKTTVTVRRFLMEQRNEN